VSVAPKTEAGVEGERSRLAARNGRRRVLRPVIAVFAILGPGLIAANAGNDAGGIVTYASAGAQFGYRPLFLMLMVTVGLVVIQEMCARLGAYTGKGLGALIREQFSLRITAVALLALLIANTGLVVSEFAGIAAAMQLIGVDRFVSLPVTAVVLWALVAIGNYRYAERVFLVLGLVSVTYPVAAVLSHPRWGTAASDLVWPHFSAGRGFVLMAVALIGTTITPYMQFYIASAVADRGVGPSDYPATRLDTISGAIFSDLVSVFIIVATAGAVAKRAPLTSAAQAAHALAPVAGPFAEQLFAIGLLGASALAAAVVPLSTSYAIGEAIGTESSLSRRITEARLFTGLYTLQLVIGAGLALTAGNLIRLLINAQILNGIITPVLLALILAMANRRSLLGAAANGPAFRLLATAVVVICGTMAVVAVLAEVAPSLI
jgi:NRAMP (natural resistance-associated macrophage protein)-like metal ion transporter